MPEDLTDQITENASGPKAAKGDALSVEQHSLRDQIQADRYLASKKAARATGLGLRTSQILPPGAV